MEVSQLLTLPKLGDGLSFLQSSSFGTSGSASPRRKIARLDTDSDISTSRLAKAKAQKGPIKINVVTNDNGAWLASCGLAGTDSMSEAAHRPVTNEQKRQNLLRLLRQCVRVVLSLQEKGQPTTAYSFPDNATFERIYQNCRALVTVHDAGSEVHQVFREELEKTLSLLVKTLVESKEQDVAWMGELAHYCQWFETQIVRAQVPSFTQITDNP